MLGKFFTTVAAGSLFVGGLAATHLAYAQPGPDGGPGPRGGLMAMADANKDGKLTRAELTAALNARFAKLDADKDGQITARDRDIRRQQRLDERFTAMDSDHNGQISKAEFTAAHQPRTGADAQAGRGQDGPGWGRGRHHGPGRGMMRGGPGGPGGGFGDADKNGVVTKAEFMARPLAMFDKADTNKDGVVTADELKAARPAMRGPMGGHMRGPGPQGDTPPPPPPAG